MSRISISTMEGTYALSERVEPRGDDRLVIDREQRAVQESLLAFSWPKDEWTRTSA